jgi:hypothetical protein
MPSSNGVKVKGLDAFSGHASACKYCESDYINDGCECRESAWQMLESADKTVIRLEAVSVMVDIVRVRRGEKGPVM